MRLKCPQSYTVDGERYMRHIHFVISNEKRDRWVRDMYTIGILCKVKKIPSCYGTVCVTNKEVMSMSPIELVKFVTGTKKKQKIRDTPLVLTGGTHKKRERAYKLLLLKGFVDIVEKVP